MSSISLNISKLHTNFSSEMSVDEIFETNAYEEPSVESTAKFLDSPSFKKLSDETLKSVLRSIALSVTETSTDTTEIANYDKLVEIFKMILTHCRSQKPGFLTEQLFTVLYTDADRMGCDRIKYALEEFFS